ncbi:VOC family protein [Archangium lipolyticum]|uniref:VOC family protein n=1 Tax=Archangium lipolyticum TaxID=2970465 RepID=UPI00214A34D7|nr:VOC family protein [Archangium lipolyticum]
MVTVGAFVSYDLRTTDLEKAEAFYAAVVGWRVQRSGDARAFFAGEQRVGALVALPERARAQGAPAHWLGHISVEDVEASARRVVALGGQQLGPVQRTAEGESIATLKDAQGAVFAVSSGGQARRPEAIVWHELYTTDRERAWSSYAELFGWKESKTLQMPPPVGPYQMFTRAGGERDMGAMANMARIPGVHTHWLFYLSVEDLDAALEKTRSLGGVVANGPMEVPGGGRVAQCEDPQGAAFALHHYIPAHGP